MYYSLVEVRGSMYNEFSLFTEVGNIGIISNSELEESAAIDAYERAVERAQARIETARKEIRELEELQHRINAVRFK